MFSTKFQFIPESGFRGEDFLEINQSETRMVCGGHVCYRIRTKKSSSLKLLYQMNRNLVGSIYGGSSVQIAHFIPIR
jgi:hypothetical protein